MTIFYYFYELPTPMYHWQRIHIIDELEREGHIVRTFNPAVYNSMDDANDSAIREISKYKDIDLFLTCDDQTVIYKETVEKVSKMGIPTCMIAWDNIELPFKQKKIAPSFDIVWLTSWETKYMFQSWGCKRIIFQTYAANPYAFKPDWKKQIGTVGFIGSPYGSRVNKLNDLLGAGVSCSVYSNSLFQKGYNTSQGKIQSFETLDVMIKAFRYMRFPIGRKVLYSTILNKFISKVSLNEDNIHLFRHQSVSDEKMIDLYSNFALSLNITELRDTYILQNPIHKIHLRAFEIPMSGGLQFASYNEELANYFEEDKEIVLYRSKDEMIDKAKFYLNPVNEQIVYRMKQAARRRAENEHTWTKRFNAIFESI